MAELLAKIQPTFALWREREDDALLAAAAQVLPAMMVGLAAGVGAEWGALVEGDARAVARAAQRAVQPAGTAFIQAAWQMQGHAAVPVDPEQRPRCPECGRKMKLVRASQPRQLVGRLGTYEFRAPVLRLPGWARRLLPGRRGLGPRRWYAGPRPLGGRRPGRRGERLRAGARGGGLAPAGGRGRQHGRARRGGHGPRAPEAERTACRRAGPAAAAGPWQRHPAARGGRGPRSMPGASGGKPRWPPPARWDPRRLWTRTPAASTCAPGRCITPPTSPTRTASSRREFGRWRRTPASSIRGCARSSSSATAGHGSRTAGTRWACP